MVKSPSRWSFSDQKEVTMGLRQESAQINTALLPAVGDTKRPIFVTEVFEIAAIGCQKE